MSHLPSMYPIHPYTESKSEIFFSVFFHRITSLQKDLYYIYHPLQTIRTKTSYNGFSILLKYKWRKRAAFCEKTYNVKNCSTSWGPVENSGRFTRKKKDPGRCPNLCELFNPYNFHSHSISSQSLMTWALDIFGYPLFFQSNTAVRVHRPLGPRPSKLRACRARFWLCSTPKASSCSALATANTAPSPPALIWWRERRERRERREWPENSWSFLEHLTTSGFSVRNWWESVFQPM